MNNSLWGSLDKETQQVYLQILAFLETFHNRVAEAQKKWGKNFSLPYRCHSLCRFVAAHVPTVTCVDGIYLGMRVAGSVDSVANLMELAHCDHSWLASTDGTIFDPYPVGVITLNPVVIPWNETYRPFAYQLYEPRNGVVVGDTETITISEIDGLLKFFPVPELQPA